jgi:hypothetical protein
LTYQWWWARQLERWLNDCQLPEAGIFQVKQISDPYLHFFWLEVFIPHPGQVHATLVFICHVYSGLAWLHLTTDKITAYTWSIQS